MVDYELEHERPLWPTRLYGEKSLAVSGHQKCCMLLPDLLDSMEQVEVIKDRQLRTPPWLETIRLLYVAHHFAFLLDPSAASIF